MSDPTRLPHFARSTEGRNPFVRACLTPDALRRAYLETLQGPKARGLPPKGSKLHRATHVMVPAPDRNRCKRFACRRGHPPPPRRTRFDLARVRPANFAKRHPTADGAIGSDDWTRLPFGWLLSGYHFQAKASRPAPEVAGRLVAAKIASMPADRGDAKAKP